MTYAVDVKKTIDIGGYRFFLSRHNQVVKVTRRLLKGKKLASAAKPEDVPEHEIPEELVSMYRQLKAGKMPVLA